MVERALCILTRISSAEAAAEGGIPFPFEASLPRQYFHTTLGAAFVAYRECRDGGELELRPGWPARRLLGCETSCAGPQHPRLFLDLME